MKVPKPDVPHIWPYHEGNGELLLTEWEQCGNVVVLSISLCADQSESHDTVVYSMAPGYTLLRDF